MSEKVRIARGGKPDSGGRPFKLTTKDAAISDALRWASEVERYLKALLQKACDGDGNEGLVIENAMADQDPVNIRDFADALKRIQNDARKA